MPLTTESLVSTKLRPSQARPQLVARLRLTAALEREPSRKLTLISAPAGFGKTTLLVEWLRERAGGEGYVAWVSLDEGDNDPVRFLSYLVVALRRTVGEDFGEGVLAALRSPEPPRMEAVLGALINELADLPGEVDVVLDDYHVIESENIHWIVTFLLERLPENFHLVISGRVDPPMPLARLRARGQMMELHAADLRFTPEEAAAFLNDAMGLDISAGDIAALEGVTEGWIAALQLAALDEGTQGRLGLRQVLLRRTPRRLRLPGRRGLGEAERTGADVLVGDLDPGQSQRPIVRRGNRTRRRTEDA